MTARLSLLIVGLIATLSLAADKPPIRVTVWDEQQPAQKKGYGDKWLGQCIAEHLGKNPALKVRYAPMPAKGQTDQDSALMAETLDQTDVLIWWGHARHREVKWETGDAIVERIKANKLALVALHSAQGSTPFIRAMNARSIEDALKTLPQDKRATAKLDLVYPNYRGVKKDTPLTPSFTKSDNADGTITLRINLPHCVFPSWREEGEPTRVTVLAPDHPIAKGLPRTFNIEHDEMYDEPFHVPAPDLVIFEHRWDKGEKHRGGMLWSLGKGNVFYYQAGHETYGVYKEELPNKVVENACLWLGEQVRSAR